RLASFQPHSILGVSKTATPKEIKQAYLKKVMQYHPDRAQGDKEELKRKFVDVVKAYEALTKPGATFEPDP
ncbi:DnaJ domain-containing protein, partial [Gorgonomyces haynaldii]